MKAEKVIIEVLVQDNMLNGFIQDVMFSTRNYLAHRVLSIKTGVVDDMSGYECDYPDWNFR